MSEYTKFDSEIYSEDLQPVSESEHDEVMQMIAAEDWQGYGDWSAELESENFVIVSGQLQHKPQPPSQGRIGGYEL